MRALARGARRRDPRPQLPAARDPGRRRLRRRLARALPAGGARPTAETIVFCGVHFMAETASILCPDKRVLIPDPDAGCSLADSITAEQLREWKADASARRRRHVRQHDRRGEGARPTTAAPRPTRSRSSSTSIASTGEDTEILFGPDMFLGAYVEKTLGRSMHVWDGECHVHAGIRPVRHHRGAGRPPRRRLPHPPGVRLLDERHGVRRRRRRRRRGRAHALDRRDARLRPRALGGGGTAIVATETGMLHPLRQAAPDIEFIAANEAAHCRFMKMITLPEAPRRAPRRRARGEGRARRSPTRARVPIERMVAIS